MNFQTFFKKRVYQYLNFRYIASYKNVKKVTAPNYIGLDDFISTIKGSDYDEIVLVASGPSSKLLKKHKRHLYLCTNNSVDLVHDQDFLYLIQDYFYTLRYLKNHFPHKGWKGTYCIINENGYEGNRKVHSAVARYLSKFVRDQKELLMSDVYKQSPFYDSFQEFNRFLSSTFDFKFVSLNSGFSMLMFSTFLSYKLGLPIRVYGLDFGLGGYEYFDGSKIEAHCSYSDTNKNTMSVFYKKLYEHPDFKVFNHSYFQSNV